MEEPITRRQFHKVAATFGLTSTLLAWTGLGGARAASLEALAASASDLEKRRSKKKARFDLKFGAAHFTREGLKFLPNGSLSFVADLEERTDGEIRVEYVGGNRLCREKECAKMAVGGEIDFFSASTQNAAAEAPYFNVLDFPYLWPSRAAQYRFFYSPRSETLLREPLRKFHQLHLLFTHCELRSFMMGLKYKEKPKIMTVDALSGAKVRVTGSQLGRIAMKLLGVRPVPVPWSDTLRALEGGALDGAETWSSAVPYGDWGRVISQDVRCRLFSGNAMTSMNLDSFEKLGAELQGALMESAYLTQVDVQKTSEAKLVTVTGITAPPLPGSYYHEHGIRNCLWSAEELEKAERMTSPRFNPEPWEKWRTRLDRMAGGIDIFESLYEAAREMPEVDSALDVEPRRWWKG